MTHIWNAEHHDPIKRAKTEAEKPLSQRLSEQADAEERLADSFKGCSFMGEWPGSHHLRQASLLRQAAIVALKSERAAAKPAKRKRKK